MARITIPEFKSGEPLDTTDFSSMDTSLVGLKVDEENLAIEGIGQRSVTANTVFSPVENNSLSKSTRIEQTSDRPVGTGYHSERLDGLFNAAYNKVVLSDIASTEDVLVRVSCRVTMSDFGARTFRTGGKPPWVALVLRKLEDGVWTDIRQTWQHFALAFTGKIDGVSAYQESLPGVVIYAGYQTGPDWGDGKMFDYEFSYTSAYLYRPEVAKTNIQFSLWGTQQLYDAGTDISTDYDYPKQTGFYVRDYNIHAYKIKR